MNIERPQVSIAREFRFEAAHRLPFVPDGHKCGRLHGHSYRVRVQLRGPVDPKSGMLLDFAEIDAAVAPLRARLDHYYLNEIPGLENPTSENLARWLFDRLALRLDHLAAVTVRETCASSCTYHGGR